MNENSPTQLFHVKAGDSAAGQALNEQPTSPVAALSQRSKTAQVQQFVSRGNRRALSRFFFNDKDNPVQKLTISKTVDIPKGDISSNEGLEVVTTEDESVKALGKAFAKAREDAGKTQKQVAKEIGTSQSAINRIERGQGNPSWKNLHKFAKAIGKDIFPSLS